MRLGTVARKGDGAIRSRCGGSAREGLCEATHETQQPIQILLRAAGGIRWFDGVRRDLHADDALDVQDVLHQISSVEAMRGHEARCWHPRSEDSPHGGRNGSADGILRGVIDDFVVSEHEDLLELSVCFGRQKINIFYKIRQLHTSDMTNWGAESFQTLQRWVTVLANQLSTSHDNYQYTHQTYDFSYTQQVSSNGRKEYWYSERDI